MAYSNLYKLLTSLKGETPRNITSKKKRTRKKHAKRMATLFRPVKLMRGIEVHESGGMCPYQAEGIIDGNPFYFRSRGMHASMGIGEDPVGISMGLTGGWSWCKQITDEEYGAGWISENEAFTLINEAVLDYRKEAKNERP